MHHKFQHKHFEVFSTNKKAYIRPRLRRIWTMAASILLILTVLLLHGYCSAGSRVQAQNRSSSLRGQPPMELKFTCPIGMPPNGSGCLRDASDGEDEATCLYNFVPSPQGGTDGYVPSISCMCTTNGHWSCSVAPEYLTALTQAAPVKR
jgi:hypothetical protein